MKPDRLTYFKQLLTEEKERILYEYADGGKVDEALIKELVRGDIFDSTSARMEYEHIMNMDENKKRTLAMIDKALVKIEKGTYGICEGTGDPIDEERLEVIPYTPYTLTYAMKKKTRRVPPHLQKSSI